MPTFRVDAEYTRSRDFPDTPLLAVRAYINTHRAGHLFLMNPGSPQTVLHSRLVRLYQLEDKAELLDELAVQPPRYHPTHGRQPNMTYATLDWNQQAFPIEGMLGMNWFARYSIVSLHMPADDEPFIELTT